MGPKLYIMQESAPSRAVLLTAKALNIELEIINLDVANGAHLKPDYLKLNPQHTIPTLDDNGKVICDSHAINTYLISTYSNNRSLYPEDPYERALVDQKLYFEASVLFPPLRNTAMGLSYKLIGKIEQEKIDQMNQGYEFLNKYLDGQQWVTGSSVTLADLTLIATVTTMNIFVPIDSEKYPNISAWIRRAEEWPYYEVNKLGLQGLRKIFAGLGIPL